MEEAYTEDDLRQMLRNIMKSEDITQDELARRINPKLKTTSHFSEELSGARSLSGKTLTWLGFRRTVLFRKIKRNSK